jgi:hypothetical protein
MAGENHDFWEPKQSNEKLTIENEFVSFDTLDKEVRPLFA